MGEMMERKGNWIETYSGVKFYPLDPRPEDVKLEDIAHSLSHQCRFGGHCKQFYSVVQHSLMVKSFLWIKGYPPETQLLGLMHDFAEVYVMDMPSPLKNMLPQFKEIEQSVLDSILAHFGITDVSEEVWDAVKWADICVLDWEANALDKNKNGWANEPIFSTELRRNAHPEMVKLELIDEFNRLWKLVKQ